MRIALAADHAGAELKDELMGRLAPLGHELIDSAATAPIPTTTIRTSPAPWLSRSSTAGPTAAC